ncbi:flagellar export chaperone FliS [Aquabacterium sp.]|uniref:flagellar export chaperone FliS n=1 Tax=Aquabacterium sp. TaxID=1872578 RepID=UPI0026164B14|nr:flagellar export chaperone FliS [Aquabacterium sp.]MDD2976687.1 flagellar export chaperone FliS [Aquabacterium sp.]
MTGMYRQVGVETSVNTASPHQLIKLLLDGFFEAVTSARGAIRAKDVEKKTKAFQRAIGIIDEGLKASLDMKAGGELASNLSNLYAYISVRLTQANLRSDEAILDECITLMTPVREAWIAIADQADHTPVRGGLEIRA